MIVAAALRNWKRDVFDIERKRLLDEREKQSHSSADTIRMLDDWTHGSVVLSHAKFESFVSHIHSVLGTDAILSTPVLALQVHYDLEDDHDRGLVYTRGFLKKLLERYRSDILGSIGGKAVWDGAEFQHSLTLSNMLKQERFHRITRSNPSMGSGVNHPYLVLNRLLALPSRHKRPAAVISTRHGQIAEWVNHPDVQWIFEDGSVDAEVQQTIKHLNESYTEDYSVAYCNKLIDQGVASTQPLADLVTAITSTVDEQQMKGTFSYTLEQQGMWTENLVYRRVLDEMNMKRSEWLIDNDIDNMRQADFLKHCRTIEESYRVMMDKAEMDLVDHLAYRPEKSCQWIADNFAVGLNMVLKDLFQQYTTAVKPFRAQWSETTVAFGEIDELFNQLLHDSEPGHCEDYDAKRRAYVDILVEHSKTNSILKYLNAAIIPCLSTSVLFSLQSSTAWRDKVKQVNVEDYAHCSKRTCDFFDNERKHATDTEVNIDSVVLPQWSEKAKLLSKRLIAVKLMVDKKLDAWELRGKRQTWEELYKTRIAKCVTLPESCRLPFVWWEKLFTTIPSRHALVDWCKNDDPNKFDKLLARLSKPAEDVPQQFVSWVEVQKALFLLQWADAFLLD